MQNPNAARVHPTDREVVDIMDAAQPATEVEVVECLRYLHDERGLKPGTRHGPRHFSWFRTVVAEYFYMKRQRQFPPIAQAGGELPTPNFEAMTAAIDTTEAEAASRIGGRT